MKVLLKDELNHVLFASTHLDVLSNKFIYYKWVWNQKQQKWECL